MTTRQKALAVFLLKFLERHLKQETQDLRGMIHSAGRP